MVSEEEGSFCVWAHAAWRPMEDSIYTVASLLFNFPLVEHQMQLFC
jgi:hypothetical protein